MRVQVFLLGILLVGLAFFMPHFASSVRNRPIYEKLGFVPKGKIYRAVVGEFRWFLGEYYTFKAITYYGTKVKKVLEGKRRGIEYYNLYKTIETAVILNPYHEDAYYFAQAVFTWDLGRVREVNRLLRHVLKYRYWDDQIPFFLGFNYGFFLRDYEQAARYFKIAAKLSGVSYYATLSARYFYEAGRTKLGILFLEEMIKRTRNEKLRRLYEKRLKALKAIKFLEDAVDRFRARFHRKPKVLDELVSSGIIERIPDDPYGGRFYIDDNGRVRTTSKMVEKHRPKGKQ